MDRGSWIEVVGILQKVNDPIALRIRQAGCDLPTSLIRRAELLEDKEFFNVVEMHRFMISYQNLCFIGVNVTGPRRPEVVRGHFEASNFS